MKIITLIKKINNIENIIYLNIINIKLLDN